MKSSIMKSPSSSYSSLKTLIQTFIFSHVYRAARAISKAKSQLQLAAEFRKSKKKKLSSFRLHYNWSCASHVMPLAQDLYQYHDAASWNAVVPATAADDVDQNEESSWDGQLSKYLQWVEDQKGNNINHQESRSSNEIDKMADLFIANCHEKFRLEKQESYRRSQEMMMATSHV